MSRLRRAHVLLALVLGVLAAATVLSTLLPGVPIMPGAVVALVFALVFPVFGIALVPVALSRPKVGLRDMAARRTWKKELRATIRERIPATVRNVIVTVFVAAWLAAMSGILSAKGQPERHHGHYYANDHGSLIPLTKAGYDHQVAVEHRGFSAIAVAFYAITVGLVMVGPINRSPPEHPLP